MNKEFFYDDSITLAQKLLNKYFVYLLLNTWLGNILLIYTQSSINSLNILYSSISLINSFFKFITIFNSSFYLSQILIFLEELTYSVVGPFVEYLSLWTNILRNIKIIYFIFIITSSLKALLKILAIELSKKVIEKNIDEEKNRELIGEFITKVGNS